MTIAPPPTYKILVAHNFYKESGGEDVVFASEIDLLRRHGHEVIEFTEDNAVIERRNQFSVGLNALWSRATYRKLSAVLAAEQPDVAHFHNIFPLITPSAYRACRAANVPVVQTVHNYRMRCPAYHFYRNGAVCEDCNQHLFPWPAVAHGCYRGSRAASLVASAATTSQRLVASHTKSVDAFIALTEFSRCKLVEAGLPADRIYVKPNFVEPDLGSGEHGGDYALFVGRLAPEKGIQTLIRAWSAPQIRTPLIIVGTGPLNDLVEDAAARNPAIQWFGRREPVEVLELLGRARFLIMPSEWYETFGRVVVEAYSRGTPVLASNIGAVAELVRNGRTGLLFNPGDPADLAAKVDWFQEHSDALVEMRIQAREEFRAKFTAERNVECLHSVYEAVMRPRP